MSDRIFLDTNIIVYSYSNNEKGKQEIARFLITENESVISTQVLQELMNTATRKLGFSFSNAILALEECIQNNHLYRNTEETLKMACKIAEKERFSFYDSLIIAAAIESDCKILYTEDMQDGRIINGILKIENPFSKK
jgi:predicted nucleic acid-binding protein